MLRGSISPMKMLFMLPWSHIGYPLIAVGSVINISKETLYAVDASARSSVKLAPEIGGGYITSVEELY